MNICIVFCTISAYPLNKAGVSKNIYAKKIGKNKLLCIELSIVRTILIYVTLSLQNTKMEKIKLKFETQFPLNQCTRGTFNIELTLDILISECHCICTVTMDAVSFQN